MQKLLAATASALASSRAAAHGGHGFEGPHGYASDLPGLAVMLGRAAAAFRLWRRTP